MVGSVCQMEIWFQCHVLLLFRIYACNFTGSIQIEHTLIRRGNMFAGIKVKRLPKDEIFNDGV